MTFKLWLPITNSLKHDCKHKDRKKMTNIVTMPLYYIDAVYFTSHVLLVTKKTSWPLVCMAKVERSNSQSHQTSSWSPSTVCTIHWIFFSGCNALTDRLNKFKILTSHNITRLQNIHLTFYLNFVQVDVFSLYT